MKYILDPQMFGGRGASSGGGGGGGGAGNARSSGTGTGKVSILDAQTALETAMSDDPEFDASARALQWNNTLPFDIKNSVDRNGETVDESITRAKKLAKEQAKLRFGEYQGKDSNGNPYFVKEGGTPSFAAQSDVIKNNKAEIKKQVRSKRWGKYGLMDIDDKGIVTLTEYGRSPGAKTSGSVFKYRAFVDTVSVKTTVKNTGISTEYIKPKFKFRLASANWS